MRRYDHRKIEKKWQKYWQDNRTFRAEIRPNRPKYYVLDMFPYISGSGLHVGHVIGYTATDIIARHRRQKGDNVLHPMGWDSFGLPSEQHAIRTGTHPSITTKKNIAAFKRQLQSIGFSYDWDREITTSDPSYYKWTQWIFTKLYEKGLAYEAELPVNWCPALGTVLANEEVENGKSIEGGHLVERRPLRQWVLKITAYAEKLIEDLDLVDWPESLKRLQTNWIGRSEGANVYFRLQKTREKITVFTTRPDTLFGATYLVLAPEHPLVHSITTAEQKETVITYQKAAALKSDLDRTDLAKEKTGVFTGAYAINPVNEQPVPIWISDYVLISYGTGAIMAVPAHDERDFAFAQTHQLPIIAVYEPNTTTHPDWIPEGMSPEALKAEVINGKRCWPGEGRAIQSANSDLSLNGLGVKKATETTIQWLERKGVGKATVSYKLRDWLFSRQRYWGEPFPILHFADGSKRTLNSDELPLCPPEVTDFKPSGDGQSPIAKVRDWVEIIDPVTGKPAKRETHTMPQWAGSCWYYLRFCDPQNEKQAWSREAESYWLPVDLYVGGVEHAVLHLLYARFWHKVLYDCGLVSTKEPFQSLRNQGLMVARSYKDSKNRYVPPSEVVTKGGLYQHKQTGEPLTSQIEKMSKSKLNGISPDDVIEEFGADSLRLYEMFMGPLEKEKVWNSDAVSGCRRFLSRFYEMATSEKVTEEESEEALRLGHRLLKAVQHDIEGLYLNTAIAKMMEFLNNFVKLPKYPLSVVKCATQLLMPFAPHLAEEIWELLGFQEELSYAPLPKVDPKYLEEELVTYVIQVNGRIRGSFDLPKGEPQENVLAAAKENQNIQRFLDGKKVTKIIFVPNRLLNLVVH